MQSVSLLDGPDGSEPGHRHRPHLQELGGDALPDGDGVRGTGDDIADDRHPRGAPSRAMCATT